MKVAGGLLQGSSPLTRGKPTSRLSVSETSGLIPAHAGKTRPEWAITLSARAHPRSRGENDAGKTNTTDFEGSSPLTRGKPTLRVLAGSGMGLIPAHAGKTCSGAGRRSGFRAHPRSRGENGQLSFSAGSR